MSLADDILFEPVGHTKTIIPSHQSTLIAISQALDGLQDIQFAVDPNFPIDLYEKIADLVEGDLTHKKYIYAMVGTRSVKRPSDALTIKEVFRRIHSGNTKFFHCGKANSAGATVAPYEFSNKFGIRNRLPYLELQGPVSVKNCFEWWAASLITGQPGYHDHYSFGTEDEARKYYTTTP